MSDCRIAYRGQGCGGVGGQGFSCLDIRYSQIHSGGLLQTAEWTCGWLINKCMSEHVSSPLLCSAGENMSNRLLECPTLHGTFQCILASWVQMILMSFLTPHTSVYASLHQIQPLQHSTFRASQYLCPTRANFSRCPWSLHWAETPAAWGSYSPGCVQQKVSDWSLQVSVRPMLACVWALGLCFTIRTCAESPRRGVVVETFSGHKGSYVLARWLQPSRTRTQEKLNERLNINIYLEFSEFYEWLTYRS